PDGRGIVFSGPSQQAMAWSPGDADPRRVRPTGLGGYSPVISLDGRVSAYPNATSVVLYDTETGQERGRITGTRAYDFAVAPLGRCLAADGGNELKVRLWSGDGKPRSLYRPEE